MELLWEIIYWSGLHLAFAYPLYLLFKIGNAILNEIETEDSNKMRQRIYLILCCLAVLTIEAMVFTKILPHPIIMLMIFLNSNIPGYFVWSKTNDKIMSYSTKEYGDAFLTLLIYMPLLLLSLSISFGISYMMLDLTNKMGY